MMQRNWYKNIVPPPGSEAGTSMTDASSLPQDPEFANANIWNQDNVPTEAELQAQGEQKAEEVDKWIQDLYQQNSAVHKAVEEGIRTTDITRQFYEEAPLITAPPTPEPSSDQEQAQASSSRILTFGEIRKDRQNVQGEVARFPAPGRVAPEISTRKKGKNRKAQPQVQEVRIKPTQALAPQTQPNRVEPPLSFEQNVKQPAPAQPRKFEGPTHDVRKMNYGDNCARENPTGPTGKF
ncbi:hypothetical protein TWF703_007713 [Orbilia oligospora]|uniref:Uncharacterized protein n=1 Tax=Orbilia oligospora TaxID=2813651 RepID=A0A7C8K1F2_ORBOL|nr:hypothetical protein TWF703_007713 [Orbilia oligospora]